MNSWLTDIPIFALRLRLTLEQTTCFGMTAFIVVDKDMLKYLDFPWARLNILRVNELTNQLNAVRVVDRNAYYGFNKSLGPVRSTLYSSIAYVAKKL